MLAVLNAAKPPAMPASAALMGCALADTQPLNSLSLPDTVPMMDAAPLKALPRAVPAPAAPPMEPANGANWASRSPAAPARLLHASHTEENMSAAA